MGQSGGKGLHFVSKFGDPAKNIKFLDAVSARQKRCKKSFDEANVKRGRWNQDKKQSRHKDHKSITWFVGFAVIVIIFHFSIVVPR